ncbi:hypothetical protein OAK74_02685 [bacterium]|jgi:hypothetical protein|nr:hypothetical protein [bacterium]
MNFEESIDLSLEGKLSEEEWGAFQRELLKNPELLSCYVEQRWVHAQLTSDQKFLAESANQRISESANQRISESARRKNQFISNRNSQARSHLNLCGMGCCRRDYCFFLRRLSGET